MSPYFMLDKANHLDQQVHSQEHLVQNILKSLHNFTEVFMATQQLIEEQQ